MQHSVIWQCSDKVKRGCITTNPTLSKDIKTISELKLLNGDAAPANSTIPFKNVTDKKTWNFLIPVVCECQDTGQPTPFFPR